MSPSSRPPELEVAICTFDHADLLEQTLESLAAQEVGDERWGVVVVDNNCRDRTPSVVQRFLDAGTVPGLRRVLEPIQGLTPARVRAVRATSAPWIAFVDDDCLVGVDWVRNAIAFARDNPDAGGFGGRVEPDFAGGPPTLSHYGWLFAEQDLGSDVQTVDGLVGAGMVVNREALFRSGWVDGPLLADRVAGRLVSGGDAEIALRLRSTGRPLRYTPALGLAHQIPASRLRSGSLLRLAANLGISETLADALVHRQGGRRWCRLIPSSLRRSVPPVVEAAKRSWRGRDPLDVALAGSYELGRWWGHVRTIRRGRRLLGAGLVAPRGTVVSAAWTGTAP